MPEATLTLRWQQGGETLSQEIAVVASGNGQGSFEIDVSLTALQADEEIVLAFDPDLLQGIFIESALDLVLETNSTSAPDDTIPVVGGEGFAWAASMANANPFTEPVVTAFLTNQSNAAGTVKLRGILDATP